MGGRRHGGEARGAGVGPLGYIAPLDGLRALAVLGVMSYHGGMPWAKGGFLGVDAFFVLSGFLISSLLLREWGQGGSIGLRAFWARRARRLLPALFLVLLGVAGYAALVASPDALSQIRGDALSALVYVANWHFIAAGQGYFAQAAAPSPLLHTWSLAIEEQFYILWPLVVALVLGLGRWRRSLRSLLALAIAGAAGSACLMALLYRSGDPTRVYYGTDTRAQALLVGAALAVLVCLRPEAPSGAARSGLKGLGALGAAGALWAWVNVTGATGWLYRGGFLLDAGCVAAVIATAVLVPRCAGARLLSVAPLRYIGRISYGLYLWHWPLFLYLDHARTGLVGVQLFGARMAASFAVAALSYHLIERPVRRGALRHWRGWLVAPLTAGGTALAVVVATASPALSSTALVSRLDTVPGRSAARAAPPPARAAATSGGAPVTDAAQGAATVASAVATASTGSPAKGGPVKVLLVGDSMAFVLGYGLAPVASRFGAEIDDSGIIGCGLAVGGQVADRGKSIEEAQGLSRHGWVPCADWPTIWAGYVARAHPDVVALLDGPWEVRDRVFRGRWTHIGDPAFDAYETAQMEKAVSVLGAGGARVELLTSPYDGGPEAPDGTAWPQNDKARMDRYNQLLAEVAARHPGNVGLVDLKTALDPSGSYTPVIDGITVRFSDGMHITPAGGRWLAPRIMPALVQAARAAGSA